KVAELIKELVVAFRLPQTDSDGRPQHWTLFDKTRGVRLDPEKTLDENRGVDGTSLYLEVLSKPRLLKLRVHFANGSSRLEEVLPEQNTRNFIDGLLRSQGEHQASLWKRIR